ncbi:UbiA family prenyltransferase [Nocardia brasiliensis]|uniref:UbiA family prenyltransferase n=1 Tax=Nocardia brasiliensis TaxID=37326 RepID=UPI002454F679|nr:UbiA family prenyltransferase [Nocardia brasiliensis]
MFIPALTIGIAASARNGLSPRLAAIKLALVSAFALAYLLLHCLVSQVDSLDEDRVNKPWRPLPAGRISLESAVKARDLAIIAFPLIGYLLDVFIQALIWELTVILACFTNWTNNILGKCSYSLIGALVLTSYWQIVAPMTAEVRDEFILMGIATFFSISIQDFRDKTGDLIAGRRTLPILLGDGPSRLLGVVVLAFLPFINYTITNPTMHNALSWAAFSLPTACAAVSALFLAVRRNQRTDHLAYRFLECWFALSFLGMAF